MTSQYTTATSDPALSPEVVFVYISCGEGCWEGDRPLFLPNGLFVYHISKYTVFSIGIGPRKTANMTKINFLSSRIWETPRIGYELTFIIKKQSLKVTLYGYVRALCISIFFSKYGHILYQSIGNFILNKSSFRIHV